MKKLIIFSALLLTVIFAFVLKWNQNYQSTTALIKVIEKQNDENDHYYIVGLNPSGKKIQIKIKNQDVWDLIEINKSYTMVIDQRGSDVPVLSDVIIDSEK